jgi:hypothetical protein
VRVGAGAAVAQFVANRGLDLKPKLISVTSKSMT